ncbi:Rab guanine nucleotide exchange factor SEC2 [Erysiphe neolycopersici]|uniref:Rab guanine nucleotide exchange factor SEC2 n=1 Tax=Erysiphe neolycopersici TaxID=212602 RepID=A0A420HXG8_9PEZI|nr:Rab guanine nucleotide exchange factor SEC2 [Erysiphe neolycopersici]
MNGWTNRNYTRIKRPFAQLRAISTNSTNALKSTLGPRGGSVSQSNSYSSLHAMTEVTKIPRSLSLNLNGSFGDEEGNLSTLPDPRTSTLRTSDESPTPTLYHPDLSSEVTTLSNKLINAINHQTSLDDTLSATQHELAVLQHRSKFLEQENKKFVDLIEQGLLVKKSTVDSIQEKLNAIISEERRKREEAERQKEKMDQEVLNLTATLFEEANKMVSIAREDAKRESYEAQRKNDQLKSQVADNESLMRSLQDQLAELKQVMEQMTMAHDDHTNQTSPSSPGFSKSYNKGYQTDDTDITHLPLYHEPATPTHPTNLTHLLQTVLRTDITSYQEFISLLRMSKNNTAGKRASTGSYSSIGVSLGLASHPGPSTNSSTPLSTATTSPATPATPAPIPNSHSSVGHSSTTPLKDTKFYKRALVEDIEPTLRLDNAPGLSWLAKRTVINAICEGTLIVEPMPLSTKDPACSCALCGESRDEPEYMRSYRFKTNENENAQWYPLCKYCVGRLRSTCDFLGFLRILRDGHWRGDDEESEKSAWEESVRLREQMFWSRLGGGVIPVIHQWDKII